MYMQVRYYDPVIGRFYSNDPVGYVSRNPVHSFGRYTYANNNPYRYTDPDGQEEVDQRLKLRVDRLTSGEITADQFRSENMSEAVGGGVATVVVAAVAACASSVACGAAATAVVSQELGKTKLGGPRIKQTRKDGSKTDITDDRVKEYTPNNHPKAPEGAMQKVKFENAQPGSKGYKRYYS
jgi:hypothetical protein